MTDVRILPKDGGGYTATVDGISLPIAAYVVEPGEQGTVMVSLAVAADTLQIGDPPARHADLETTRRNTPPVSTWGDRSKPDPRANIPGWTPPAASVDAHRGRSGEHRLAGDGFVAALRKLVRGEWRLA